MVLLALLAIDNVNENLPPDDFCVGILCNLENAILLSFLMLLLGRSAVE